MTVAAEYLGLEAEEREISIDEGIQMGRLPAPEGWIKVIK